MRIVFTLNDKPTGHFVLVVEDAAAATPLLVLNKSESLLWCGLQHLFKLVLLFSLSDLEWKIIYVGSAESEEYDQVLDSVLVGPVPAGRHMFVFQVRVGLGEVDTKAAKHRD